MVTNHYRHMAFFMYIYRYILLFLHIISQIKIKRKVNPSFIAVMIHSTTVSSCVCTCLYMILLMSLSESAIFLLFYRLFYLLSSSSSLFLLILYIIIPYHFKCRRLIFVSKDAWIIHVTLRIQMKYESVWHSILVLMLLKNTRKCICRCPFRILIYTYDKPTCVSHLNL